jgi:hypothetical protein
MDGIDGLADFYITGSRGIDGSTVLTVSAD